MTKLRLFQILAPVFSLACLLGSCSSAPRPEPIIGSSGEKTCGAARLEYAEGIPVITLSGTHYEMGLQFGILLRKEYSEAVTKCLSILSAIEEGSPPILRPFAPALFKAKVRNGLLRSLTTKYRDELKGLAAGSGVPYDDVVFAAAAAGTIDLACTAIVSRKEGRVLLGRNLDWAPGFFGSMPVVVRFKPEGENACISAGFLALPMAALTAVSERGIALSINIATSHKEKESSGLPVYYQSREALARAGSLSEAESIIAGYRGRESWLIGLASGDEERGSIVELTGGESRILRVSGDGAIYALNGFRDEYMRRTYSPLLDPVNVVNDDRTRLIEALLGKGEAGSIDGLLGVLADDGSPTISESRWTGQGINHNGTLLTAVIDPYERRIYAGYAPLYAGWAAVKAIDLGGGPARAYRPASPLASSAEYESIGSWYPDFLLDLYGGRERDLVGKIMSGGIITPVSFDCLCQAFESDASTADAPYLENTLAALEKTPSEFLYAVMPAADFFYGAADYGRAEALYGRALREESLLPDDRIRALTRLAAIAERDRDAERAAGFARECLALLNRFAGSCAIEEDEKRVEAEMRDMLCASEGGKR